jgi:hypothetical protein
VDVHHKAASATTDTALNAAVGPSPGMRHARAGLRMAFGAACALSTTGAETIDPERVFTR